MAIDYAALKADLVIPKIQEYGKAITLRRPGTAAAYTKSFEAATGRYKWTLIAEPHTVTYTDPSTTTTDTASYAIETLFTLEEVDDTTILASDRKFLIATSAALTTDDSVVVGGVTLRVVSVRNVVPGGTTLLCVVQCRV